MDENLTSKGIFRLSINARRALSEGSEYAKKYSYQKFDVIHLFYALITNKTNIVYEVLNKLGVDLNETSNNILKEFIENKEKFNDLIIDEDISVNFTPLLKEILSESFIIAHDFGHIYVGTEHILFSMFKSSKIDFIEEIKQKGVDYNLIKNTILSTVNYPQFFNNNQQKGIKPSFGQFSFEGVDTGVSFFYREMNELALEGNYSNITGRDKEISRLIHILSRKRKNNPILVGDAGVGKTAIVEGFVNKIIQKKVPASFYNKRVINLDIASIMSGARLRGDVEERVTNIINEVIEDGNAIIFIDEIHMIVGAGSTGGRDSLDIANILKPYLTGSELSIIGATTVDEYTKYFESDTALARRFQPITVDELSVESSKEVIYGLIPEFEKYHSVKITKEAVNEAVELTDKFIRDRYLPDKALDIIDEASATLKIGREIVMEPELNSLSDKLLSMQNKKEKLLAKGEFEKASKFKTEGEHIINEISKLISGEKKIRKKVTKTVTPELIQEIIVKATKIPIAAANINDKTLKNLKSGLIKRVIGQEKAVEEVVLAMQKSHLGLGDVNKPLASFLFLGPTGVGKTELAKTLANELFGSTSLMLQINMSELMEMHSVSKLVGSPPGYVGFDEGGSLTNFVKRKPYSVILFDEIEKAHPDTLNLLLQILDEGEVADGKGSKVSLRNCIVIMTSNIGAQDISQDNRLGFNIDVEIEKESEIDSAYQRMKDKIMEELRNILKPELINRIDSINVFRGLNNEDCLKITEKMVDEFKSRLIKKGVFIDVNYSVVKFINEEGYSTEYGARNLRRKVQEVLENGFASYLINSNISKKKGDVLKVYVDLSEDNKLIFSKLK